MSLEPQNKCELRRYGDDPAFRAFLEGNQSGILMVAEPFGNPPVPAMKEDAGDFAKWVRQTAPFLRIAIEKSDHLLMLRSSDIWLPLAYIAHDVGLPVYLNLVSSYLYEKMKGSLKGDSDRVHLSAIYEDRKKGILKRFDFDGGHTALGKAIKRLDLDEFFNE